MSQLKATNENNVADQGWGEGSMGSVEPPFQLVNAKAVNEL